MTEKTPEQITDEFLSNLQKGNYQLNPNAKYEATYRVLGDSKNELKDSLEKYNKFRYDPTKTAELRGAAIVCVAKITNAWLHDLVRENEKASIKIQIKELDRENSSLKEVNNKLAKENDHLKKQIVELHETIDRLTARGLNNCLDDR